MDYYSQTQHFRICNPTVNDSVQRTITRHYFTKI